MNGFAAAPAAIRDDLARALEVAWPQLGEPGAWLDGESRLAMAAAARQAWDCRLCRDREAALSPHAVAGDHDGDLPQAWLEVIHRIAVDPGRLGRRWFDAAMAAGLDEDSFIEMIAVTVLTATVDTFCLGIGLAPPDLPPARPGDPARQAVAQAKTGPGWVKTIAPEDAPADFADFYANDSHFYIRRALTGVPAETRKLWALLNRLYLEDPRIHELDGVARGISRAQMEFLAARASALLGCFY